MARANRSKGGIFAGIGVTGIVAIAGLLWQMGYLRACGASSVLGPGGSGASTALPSATVPGVKKASPR